MSEINKNNWTVYCEHANECPTICPCPPECGCHIWGSCKDFSVAREEKDNHICTADDCCTLEERQERRCFNQKSAAENKKQLEKERKAMEQILKHSPEPRKNPYILDQESSEAPRLDANTTDQKCFIPKPQQQGINPHTDTKLSIFAGIGQDDGFIFEIMGSEKTFSNLTGLESFISARIQQEKDKKLHTGDALILSLFQNIQQLNAKVDTLLSTLDRPSNKL